MTDGPFGGMGDDDKEPGLGGALSGLVKMNDLAYEAEEEYTLTSQVRMREFPFLGSLPANGTAFVDLSVGSDLINGRKSYLQFDLTFTGYTDGDIVNFPPGVGATQLFRQILIQARSGTEISRHMNRHLIQRHEMSVTKPLGKSELFGATYAARGANIGLLAAGTTVTMCIPLSDLHNFFDTKNLIPTNVMGLIRLELSTVDKLTAYVSSANRAGGNFALSKLAVWCQTHTLSDAGQKAMAFIAADRGLNFYFTDIVGTSQNFGAVTSFSLTNTMARSRCLGAWVHLSQTAWVAFDQDSTRTETPTATDQIFWGLGSLYWPIRPLSGLQPLFHHFLIHENAYVSGMHERVPEIRYSDSRDPPISWLGGFGFHSVNLERSEILEANGSAIGASRPLTLQMQGLTANAGTSIAYVFVKHHKLLTIASDGNMVISE